VPTVLRWDGYRAFFYSNEGHEPPHAYVVSNDREAKFWLENLEVVVNYGFSDQDVKHIRETLVICRLQLLDAWKEHFGD
jgi:Domain of unknown function (DUF4160)